MIYQTLVVTLSNLLMNHISEEIMTQSPRYKNTIIDQEVHLPKRR